MSRYIYSFLAFCPFSLFSPVDAHSFSPVAPNASTRHPKLGQRFSASSSQNQYKNTKGTNKAVDVPLVPYRELIGGETDARGFQDGFFGEGTLDEFVAQQRKCAAAKEDGTRVSVPVNAGGHATVVRNTRCLRG